jgi:hypothetical protein
LHKESHFGIAHGAASTVYCASILPRSSSAATRVFYFSCLATRFYSPDAAAVQTHWLVMALLWLFANFIALHSQGFTCFKV